jgi:hypothetical protein
MVGQVIIGLPQVLKIFLCIASFLLLFCSSQFLAAIEGKSEVAAMD